MAFWEEKALEEMTPDEWESLCDGCARCCLHKLEDEDSGDIHYTRVVCRLLDQEACRCTRYQDRNRLVPTCVWLTPETARTYEWLPDTCAYRRLALGQSLPEWHPLISGDAGSVAAAGITVTGMCVSEEHVHPDGYEEHIITWVDQAGGMA